MSIIHDALKKAQKTSCMPASPEDARGAQEVRNPAPAILAVGLGLAIVIAFWILKDFAREALDRKPMAQAPETPSTPLPEAAAEKIAPAVMPQIPTAPEDPATFLRIEGIMDTGSGEKLALINGKVLEVGQAIKGWVIQGISLEQVTIRKDNEEKTIPVIP
ncbi:MAG: hypothetical protein GX606_02130 [Elusimicrobia bacterium]|nr:hypothetical protein [Elusimicrobiota bacterium]